VVKLAGVWAAAVASMLAVRPASVPVVVSALVLVLVARSAVALAQVARSAPAPVSVVVSVSVVRLA
jgi:hypothetical protein